MIHMVAWSDLFLPIALSTVFVFFASSIVHMVLKWHNPDYHKLSNEDEVRAVIRKGAPQPGEYVIPMCKDAKDMQDPAMVQKFAEGPNLSMWIRKPGKVELGPFLMKWVVYTLVVSCLCAYFARFTVGANADYMRVFHVVGMAAWLAYSWQGPADSIWKGKPWISTFRYMIDGLFYALVTAGTFGWLWPK
jgi:hypothetical protein